MALTPAGHGRYDGELNEHWTIGPKGSGPKVHGGAMLALCANAARLEHADDVGALPSQAGGPPPRNGTGEMAIAAAMPLVTAAAAIGELELVYPHPVDVVAHR